MPSCLMNPATSDHEQLVTTDVAPYKGASLDIGGAGTEAPED